MDPYRVYNGLDEHYVPFDPMRGTEPRRPPFPGRVRAFIYACGFMAQQQAGEGQRTRTMR
jgi:hypothetical protein